MQTFDFDTPVDRRAVPALKTHPMVLGEGGETLFPAGVADMDFHAAPCIIEAMQARLNHGVFGYEAIPDALFPAIAEWQKTRHGWALDPAHILRAPNVLNILATAAAIFTAEGDGIIVQPPVFFDFYDILAENHRRIVHNPLRHDGGTYRMDFDDLEAKAADPRTKMLFLCNPHNPVGRVWSADELRRLGDICARNGVLVVSDEIHADITFTGHPYTPFASLGPQYADNAVTCLSPAKSFNIASCAAAHTVVSNDDMRAAFKRENSRLTVSKNNAFANAAMVAAYTNGAEWLDAALDYLEGNATLVRDRLADVPGVRAPKPEGTFLAWLDFRALGLPPDKLTKFLRENAGLATTRGQSFGVEGAGFARLNFATQRARLEQALDRLVTALRYFPRP